MAKRLWTYRGKGEIKKSINNALDDNKMWGSIDAIRLSPYNQLTRNYQQYYIIPNDAKLEGL